VLGVRLGIKILLLPVVAQFSTAIGNPSMLIGFPLFAEYDPALVPVFITRKPILYRVSPPSNPSQERVAWRPWVV